MSFFQPAMDADATEIWLNVTANRISMGFKPGPNAAKPETRERPKYDQQVLTKVHRESKASRRPKWASAGHAYKGEVLEVEGAVLYQLVRGQVVVHELALLPQPVPAKGVVVEYVYGEGVNDVAVAATPKAKGGKAK